MSWPLVAVGPTLATAYDPRQTAGPMAASVRVPGGVG